MDGNIRNEPVIATCIHSGLKSFFLNVKDGAANMKTTKYSTNTTSEEIKNNNNLGIYIFAVHTDRKNKMLNAKKLFKEKRENLIIHVYSYPIYFC